MMVIKISQLYYGNSLVMMDKKLIAGFSLSYSIVVTLSVFIINFVLCKRSKQISHEQLNMQREAAGRDWYMRRAGVSPSFI